MGNVGCDIWEKWVVGRKLKNNKRWDMGKVGCDIWEKGVGGRLYCGPLGTPP